MTYIDTSALVKLFRTEFQSSALRAYLSQEASSARLAASALVLAELPRALLRAGVAVSVQTAASRFLAGRILTVSVSDDLLRASGKLSDPGLRTLDAIHIETALKLGSLAAFLTYDGKMAHAAAAVGLPVNHPGGLAA
ncbi:MAG: type II toxin-antitoxin system VapC family toxin [Candidatus Dormibacteraeota bacterium]|uniref:Ribonuclease VapC n=1 Tax=Candidatus Dormiibacter inghamiae TaxID=3127013 RepID=A0A934N7G6_9BACT|nr:type II toxin-antitoxin system VapC family toxin [Candidatus Dormibacteraeota bacterium]MBJ7607358.1 type II toxin-antitoxin system VapC family toxin [Candidatus Dormibacteraeota bacterium]